MRARRRRDSSWGVRKNVDTAPDGFYAVCRLGRGGVVGFFWAAWWASSGLAATPVPDAHGLADRIEEAHARARAAIRRAKGDRASVLSLDAQIAVEAARIVRPASPGYDAGSEWWGEEPRRRPASREPEPSRRSWLQVLELSWPCSAADVRKAYRRLALQRHPDRGGTNAAFNTLTKARDAALREVEPARA
ncbi:MAG: DnaJ domain-containing protein [Byssovorax sp.]